MQNVLLMCHLGKFLLWCQFRLGDAFFAINLHNSTFSLATRGSEERRITAHGLVSVYYTTIYHTSF